MENKNSPTSSNSSIDISQPVKKKWYSESQAEYISNGSEVELVHTFTTPEEPPSLEKFGELIVPYAIPEMEEFPKSDKCTTSTRYETILPVICPDDPQDRTNAEGKQSENEDKESVESIKMPRLFRPSNTSQILDNCFCHCCCCCCCYYWHYCCCCCNCSFPTSTVGQQNLCTIGRQNMRQRNYKNVKRTKEKEKDSQ